MNHRRSKNKPQLEFIYLENRGYGKDSVQMQTNNVFQLLKLEFHLEGEKKLDFVCGRNPRKP